jgi:acyl dehydratase
MKIGPLTRTDLVRYQGASGDFNPLHHDEPFALSLGMPAPLSLGMLQAGLLATWATDRFGAAGVRGFRVRFAAQVFPGDTVTCDGRIVRRDASSIDVEMTCTKQDGTVAVYGWATFATSEDS